MAKVKDIMTGDVITASLPGTREDIIEIMTDGVVSSIPVVNESKYRGLVSRDELLAKPGEDQLAMLMREVEPVGSDTSIEDCARKMMEGDERRLPVLTDGDKVEGILTLTDITGYIADHGDETDIGELIEEGILTIWEETPIDVAVNTLLLNSESAACILDNKNEMVGILTETDCVGAADVDLENEVIGEAVAAQDDQWMWEGIQATSTELIPVNKISYPDEPVSSFMSDDVETVVRSTNVSDAAEHMYNNGIHHLPVRRGDQLVGMLDDTDLLEHLVR
ncbi:MAG: CBS domain-containing protein [Halobacteria archaeon]